MPSPIESVPSVVISGGTRNTEMRQPFNKPAARPTQREESAETLRLHPLLASPAAITADKTQTAATERSIPAVMMTSVWPSAAIVVGAATNRIATRLEGRRKMPPDAR